MLRAAGPGGPPVAPGAVIAEEVLPTCTTIWCAGITPSSLIERLHLPVDVKGYILTRPDLRVQGFENVWAIGDCAVVHDPQGHPYPATGKACHPRRQACRGQPDGRAGGPGHRAVRLSVAGDAGGPGLPHGGGQGARHQVCRALRPGSSGGRSTCSRCRGWPTRCALPWTGRRTCCCRASRCSWACIAVRSGRRRTARNPLDRFGLPLRPGSGV